MKKNRISVKPFYPRNPVCVKHRGVLDPPVSVLVSHYRNRSKYWRGDINNSALHRHSK